MTKMITLLGRDLSELRFNDLKRERRCHSFLLTRMRYMLKDARVEAEKRPHSAIRQDKVLFFEMYVSHLEAIIAECDYWMDRRFEPASNSNKKHPKYQIKAENKKRRKRQIADNTTLYAAKQKQSLLVSWDKDKFMLIASDRGYQTEEAVIVAVARELKLNSTKARHALQEGRFTWGQVLVLGAFMEMTPKEFCDTFLAGYFTEKYGEFRSDYENISKEQLLKRAMREDPLFGIEKTEIEVGADGKPADEEVWLE